MKKALIKASISSASEITQTLSTSKIEDMIMQLGSGSKYQINEKLIKLLLIELDTSSVGTLITAQSNIKLDTTKQSKKTNDYGIAYFNLLILEGKNGNYKLTFSAQGATSKSTSIFTLANPISNVTFYQNVIQTIEVLYIS